MTEPTTSGTGTTQSDESAGVEAADAEQSPRESSPVGTSPVETPPADTADTADTGPAPLVAAAGEDSAERSTEDSAEESAEGLGGTVGSVEGAAPQEDIDSEEGAGSEERADSEEGAGVEVDVDRLEREGDIAADYHEELLDIADLDGDLDMDVEGNRAAVSIIGGDVRALVGRNGEVLEALQELTRLAVYRETGERSRLMLDVGGFRADKRSRLEKIAAEAIAEVQRSGERKALDPMTPFERKVVHDAVAAAGLSSASEGAEPRRFVVVLPG